MDGNINIPNAFSPNGDSNNDLFGIPALGVRKVIYFRVYNRNGELVYQRKDFAPGDASNSWNGRFKGVEAPIGGYVFLAELECTEGIRFQKKGTVMLVR